MVHLSSAFGSGDDTTQVSLEGKLVGLNGDGDWLLVDGGLHLGDIVLWDTGRSLVGVESQLGVRLALEETGRTSVWVGFLALNEMSLGVHVGEDGVSSLASHVWEVGAVNDLLLGESGGLTGGNSVHTLEGSGGGESPA